MSYSFESRVRYSEIGENKKLTLPAVIDYFQDCTTFQSEDLGIGLEYLGKRNRAWFISYWQIEFERFPSLGEKISVTTNPYEIKGVFGKRNFWMKDEKGEILAKADSLWVFLDTAAMRPAKVDLEVAGAYEMGTALPMEALSRKVRLSENAEKMEEITILKSHLDTNHHVNNAQYIYMAQQYLPEDVNVKRIRVEYKKSAKLGDKILPLVVRDKDLITIGLCDMEENPFAVMEFKVFKE